MQRWEAQSFPLKDSFDLLYVLAASRQAEVSSLVIVHGAAVTRFKNNKSLLTIFKGGGVSEFPFQPAIKLRWLNLSAMLLLGQFSIWSPVSSCTCVHQVGEQPHVHTHFKTKGFGGFSGKYCICRQLIPRRLTTLQCVLHCSSACWLAAPPCCIAAVWVIAEDAFSPPSQEVWHCLLFFVRSE